MSQERFEVLAARDVTDQEFRRGTVFPLDESAKISDLFWTDTGLQVFASDDPRRATHGHRMTLPNPFVVLVAFIGPIATWQAELDEVDPDFVMKRVIDGTGNTWVEGEAPPVGEKAAMTLENGQQVLGALRGPDRSMVIAKIVYDDEKVVVYVRFRDNHRFSKKGMALKFLMPPLCYRVVDKEAAISHDPDENDYGRLLKEAVEAEDEDDDEEEEIEVEACEECGLAEVPSTAKFCPGCGSPMPAPEGCCDSCWEELSENAKFCMGCGAKVEAAEPEPAKGFTPPAAMPDPTALAPNNGHEGSFVSAADLGDEGAPATSTTETPPEGEASA